MAKNAIHLANLARMYRQEYEAMVERAASLEASVEARIEHQRINPRIANPRLTDISTPGGAERLAAQQEEMDEEERVLRADRRRLEEMYAALLKRASTYVILASTEFTSKVLGELNEEVRRRANEDFGDLFMNRVFRSLIDKGTFDPSPIELSVSKIRKRVGIAE